MKIKLDMLVQSIAGPQAITEPQPVSTDRLELTWTAVGLVCVPYLISDLLIWGF